MGDTESFTRAGGLLGASFAPVENCASSASLLATGPRYEEQLGGLIGYNADVLQNSFSTTRVESQSKGDTISVGGLVGRNEGEVFNCFYAGELVAHGDRIDSGSGRFEGALVGHNLAALSHAYFQAEDAQSAPLPVGLEDAQYASAAELHALPLSAMAAQSFVDLLNDNSAARPFSLVGELPGFAAQSTLFSLPYSPLEGISADQIVLQDEASGLVLPRSYYIDGRVLSPVGAGRSLRVALRPLPDFDDTEGAWMEDAVNALQMRGVVQGHNSSTFAPDAPLLRVEFAALLLRFLEIAPADAVNENAFTDFASTPEWAQKALSADAAQAILSVDASGNFRPNDPCTREELFLMAHRAMVQAGLLPEAQAPTELPPFSDWAEVGSAHSAPIAALFEAGLVQGADGQVSPNSITTRAEAAQFLYNVLQFERDLLANS